jgi:hypothetical protein
MCIKNKSSQQTNASQLIPGKHMDHISYETFTKQTLHEICYPKNVPEVLFGLIV